MISKLENPEVIPIWQPQGYSTYQITKGVATKLGVKTTHTGVLDPMAEGVIIVLAGEKRFEKNKYSEGTKVYDFNIVFGISTDSYDGMGVITKIDFNSAPTLDALKKVSPAFIGDYEQEVPLYSAQKVNGKKLFMYPRLGLPSPSLPFKKGQIYDLEALSLTSVPIHRVATTIITKINNIRIGEFRQSGILKNWEQLTAGLPKETLVVQAEFRVEMSRGLYVRSLAQDICKKVLTIGFVNSLIRAKNGKYTKTDCCTLEEVC